MHVSIFVGYPELFVLKWVMLYYWGLVEVEDNHYLEWQHFVLVMKYFR
jgi:hypothetical protein